VKQGGVPHIVKGIFEILKIEGMDKEKIERWLDEVFDGPRL
jgi:hypothetical protein